MRLDPINLYEYEARAQQVLPHDTWDFIAGGSKDELTTRRNRSAFDAISLRPRFLRDVTERALATTVLGTPISFPVMISPAGGHKIAHPEGECATARGAGMSNTLMMLSTSSHCSMEEVAKAATGPLWFQLYHRGHELTHMLVRRAEHVGYKAIALTVDTPLPAPKERDMRNRYTNPFPPANFQATPDAMAALSGTDEAPDWQPARVPALTCPCYPRRSLPLYAARRPHVARTDGFQASTVHWPVRLRGARDHGNFSSVASFASIVVFARKSVMPMSFTVCTRRLDGRATATRCRRYQAGPAHPPWAAHL